MGAIPRIIVIATIFVSAVKCQECTDMVGSLDHNSNIVPFDSTYILSGYTLPCSGTVVAWEFCYRASNPPSVTFSPGIWRINYNNGDRNYMIVRSSDVTYTPVNINGTDSCLTFNLAVVDQFTAPAGSVVGLYSNLGPLLLHTDTDSSITTYQVNRNQSIVSSDNYRFVNYHIALRVHLAITSTVTLTTSVVSTGYTTTTVIVTTSAAVTQHLPTPTTVSIDSVKSSIIPPTTTVYISTSSTTTASDLSSNSGSSLDSVVIIGGALGGVILVMIIVVLCIVILCMRRSCMKEDNKVAYSITNPNKDVTVDHNRSHNVTKPNRINHLYFKTKPGVSDAPIATSPAYSVPIKHHSKAIEDECDYVQPNEFMQQSDLEDAIKALSITAAPSDTTRHYDYAYAHSDSLLQHNAASNTTDAQQERVPVCTAVDQSRNIQATQSPYLTIIAGSLKPPGEGMTVTK